MKNKMLFYLFCLAWIMNYNFLFSDEMSNKSQALTQLIDNWSEKIKLKYDFDVIGTGGSSDNGITGIAVSFSNKKPISIEEGRKLIIEMSEDFVEAINASTPLRPYLKNYPFRVDQISIVIFCFDKEGNQLFDPEISVVANSHGILTFKSNDPKVLREYKIDIHEPFEKAKEIVNQNK